MNTLRKYGAKYNVTFCTFAGLSTDTKPVGTALIDNKSVALANGSEFIEMDTDKKYLYDAENQTWNLAASGGGGGSATLIEKSITENGIYNASDDSADGYSKVTVDVVEEVFEVSGTYDGGHYTTFRVDKTRTEAVNAYNSGKTVIFKVTNTSLQEPNITTFPAMLLNDWHDNIESLYASYGMYIHPAGNSMYMMGFYYSDENNLTYKSMSVAL